MAKTSLKVKQQRKPKYSTRAYTAEYAEDLILYSESTASAVYASEN